jgi:hypothetical protein
MPIVINAKDVVVLVIYLSTTMFKMVYVLIVAVKALLLVKEMNFNEL